MIEATQPHPDWLLLTGDALAVLATLPADSVQCCITSPPYYNLRDYGTAAWVGGDAACDHRAPASARRDSPGGFHNSTNDRSGQAHPATQATVMQCRATCGKCGATRQDDQLGLEATPAASADAGRLG